MKIKVILNAILVALVGISMFGLYLLLDRMVNDLPTGNYILAGLFCFLGMVIAGSFLMHKESFLLHALWREQKCRARLEKTMRLKTQELQQLNEELKCLILTDELTGLYNRRGFFALAEHQVKLAAREQKEILVLYADVDGMKIINDTYGHQEGDIALKSVATILKDTFRDSDIVARIGGDEFAILSLQTTSANAEVLVERMQTAIKLFNDKNLLRYTLSVSMGMASFPYDYRCSIEEMLQSADKAMYVNKRNKLKVGLIS
jgi:diguanylate cyclase (GGDEF)-like protein